MCVWAVIYACFKSTRRREYLKANTIYHKLDHAIRVSNDFIANINLDPQRLKVKIRQSDIFPNKLNRAA